MFKLSYSMNGLTNLDFFTAAKEVEKAGFEGVELSFQFNQFDPFKITDDDCQKIREFFAGLKVKPACISTATAIFLSDIPHEPSLISLDMKRRQERIDLIKKGVSIAQKIGVPTVSFQSGYLRKEHVENSSVDPYGLLVDGIRECLEDIGDIQLVLEPEPGMYIETIAQAKKLIKDVGSPSFGLHVDIGHTYCTEENYVKAIEDCADIIKYMHLADIKEGFNLKFILSSNKSEIDLNKAGYFVYFERKDEYMFIDKTRSIYFYNTELSAEEKKEVAYYSKDINNNLDVIFVSYKEAVDTKSEIDVNLQTKAYLGSISGIDYKVLDKSTPILNYIRSKENNLGYQIIDKPICNTINGKVHYHEFPGNGGIDFKAVLGALKKKEYEGYVTVELYNHSDVWDSVLSQSRKYLLGCMK